MEQAHQNTIADAIEAIRRLRKGVTLGKDLTVKMLQDEGRR